MLNKNGGFFTPMILVFIAILFVAIVGIVYGIVTTLG